MNNNQKEFYIGKRWKNNKCEEQIGLFYSREAAEMNCPKGYKVFTDDGTKIYSNNNSTVRFVLIAAIALAVFIGISYSYSYFNSSIYSQSYSKQFVMPNGTVINYKGDTIVPYNNGMILIPQGGATIILPNGEKLNVPAGSVVKPDGTIIVADKDSKIKIDNHNNVIIDNGPGKIIDEKGNATKVNEGAVITDDGNIINPNKPGDVTIDDKGNIIVGDEGAKVTLPNGDEKEVDKGTVVTPDGGVVEGTETEKPVINDDGTVTVPPGGTVTTPDGKEETYENGGSYIPKLNDDATLKTLIVNGYQILPIFDSETLVYTLAVGEDITAITIFAQSNDYSAKVIGAGTKTLNHGSNSFTITVTAEDGTKRDYTIIVTRGQIPTGNNFVNLSELSVSGYEITPKFNENTTVYSVTIPNNVTSVTINATAKDSSSKVTGAGLKSNLIVGNNSYKITVTAIDGTKKDYTVIVIREIAPKSSNANLGSLRVDNYELTPKFDANSTVYSVTVPNSITSVNISATVADSNAKINGTGLKSNLVVGNNSYNVTVIAEDGTKKDYTVIIIREDVKSSNANLSSLTISGYSLTPKFNENTTVYSVTVPSQVTSITINASAKDNNANVSGTGSKTVYVGNNSYKITVTAEDGTKKDYTIIVTRQTPLSSDTTLSNLMVDGFSIVPNFKPAIKNYELTVPYDVTNINIKATPNVSKSSVIGTGNKSLEVGTNTFSIQVTAENGTKGYYYLTVTRLEKELPSGTIHLPDGTIIIPDDGTTLIKDDNGNIYVKDGDATLIDPNGDEKPLTEGAVITDDGTIINPNNPNDIKIDEDGNIIVGPGGGQITKPGDEEPKDLNGGAVITDDGTVINPNNPNDIEIDDDGNIIVGPGGGQITNPGDENPKDLNGGAVVTDDGTVINPNQPGDIKIEDGNIIIGPGGGQVTKPGDENPKDLNGGAVVTDDGTIINPNQPGDIKIEDGNIIIGPGGGQVTKPGDEEPKDLKDGDIITPDGSIIEGSETEKPKVNEDGTITIPEGGTVTKPGQEPEEYPDGGEYIPEPKSSDAKLKELTIEGYSLTPSFDPNKSSYSLMVPNDVAGVKIIAKANHAGATVRGDGFKILDVGVNTYTIKVTAEDGSIKNYNIVITRSSMDLPGGSVVMPDGSIIIPDKGTDVTIDEHGNVHIDGGSATIIDENNKETPVSDGSVITDDGTIITPNPPGKITVDDNGNIIVDDEGATITNPDGTKDTLEGGSIITPDGTIIEGTDDEDPSVEEDGTIKIPEGGTVTKPGQEPEEYPDGGEYVPQPQTGDATLKHLSIEGFAISPAFDPDVTEYMLTVANNVAEIEVNALANDSTATILGIGEKSLNFGTNVISIKVTVPDGTKKFYSITVIRSTESIVETTLYVLYEGGPQVIAEGIIPGDVLTPVTFSLTYKGTESGAGPDAINYNVLWSKVFNNFDRKQDLVVTIKRNGTVIASKVKLPEAVTEEMITDVSINKHETHAYELVVEYLYSNDDQNVDQGKEFYATVQVTLD